MHGMYNARNCAGVQALMHSSILIPIPDWDPISTRPGLDQHQTGTASPAGCAMVDQEARVDQQQAFRDPRAIACQTSKSFQRPLSHGLPEPAETF